MRTIAYLALGVALVGCRNVPDDLDEDGFDVLSDCNDGDAAIFPGAEELCDGVDNDCSGDIDEEAVDASTFYQDGDGDGSGSSATATGCDAPEGYVSETGDCNDSDSNVYPGATEADCTDPTDYNCDGSTGYADADADGFPACEECDDSSAAISPVATEVCDGVDNDCDGDADGDAVDAGTWYADTDGDGYGNPAEMSTACDQPEGSVADSSDCDDTTGDIAPGVAEICDDVDQDCDGDVDDDAIDQTTYYADVDGDGAFGTQVTTEACDQPVGYGDTATDCDDVNPANFPGATELCDGVDNDCDGAVPTDETDVDGDGYTGCDGDCDDDDAALNPDTVWYIDNDGDGFGGLATKQACEPGAGWVAASDDCRDLDETINPGVTEICDTIDNDCDGEADGEGVLGEGADCAAAHCSELNDLRSGLDDGAYWIDSNGATLPYEAYCDMTTDGGGWTLALKADGQQPTFAYSSALWTNASLLNEGDVSMERTEAKYESFNSTPFNQVMVGLESPIGSTGLLDLQTLTLDHSDWSLWNTFNSGYVATTVGRDAWKGLVTDSSLQPNCNREGFNVDGNGQDVRIGIINNQENDCNSPDSRLGVGGAGGACGTANGLTVGNTSRCAGDNGDVDHYAFAAVFTRCDSSVADDTHDGFDQNCDGFDGIDDDGDGWWVEIDCDDSDDTVFPGTDDCPILASCADILADDPSAGDGVYPIDPAVDGNFIDAYCDMTSDGGGWTMILNYNHGAGTNPALTPLTDRLPVLDSSVVSGDESAHATAWGHAAPAMADTLNFSETMWYCETAAHPRVMHFKSSEPSHLDYIRTGNGTMRGVYDGSQAEDLGLYNNATLPLHTNGENSGYGNQGALALTNFPFYSNSGIGNPRAHWGIRGGGGRWECDDHGGNANTIHQVFVR